MNLPLYRTQRIATGQPAAALPTRRRRGRGQALVEFALVFPIFMLLVFGMLDFGFALFSRMTIINAAREGARVAVMQPGDARVQPGYTALIQAAVAGAASGLTVTASAACVSNASLPSACNFNAVANSKAGDYVVVTVDYTYESFFPLLFGATFDVGSSVKMLLEN